MEACLQVQKELPDNATFQHLEWQRMQFYLKEEIIVKFLNTWNTLKAPNLFYGQITNFLPGFPKAE